MPWTCCDKELLDDVFSCPACGTSKQTWTLRFKATRVFSLPTGGWVELELADARGEPIAGLRYVVEVQDGTAREGKLDDKGFARVKTPRKAGLCKVSFPDLDASEWDWELDVTEVGGGAPAEAAAPAPALTFVELEVRSPKGAPVDGLRYVLELPDGARREGVLGRDGRAREEDVPEGTCTVSFPELDGAEWSLDGAAEGAPASPAQQTTTTPSPPPAVPTA
ncbi:MAG: hypothetical protein KF878_21575 [Planctomycetes bacterium]|nr:hypothetical protein [Planctomycetota bacterium]